MNRVPLSEISDEEVESFHRDGAVCLRGMIDDQSVGLLSRGTERNLVEPTPLHTLQTTADDPGFFLSDICMAQHIPEFREFILNGPVPEMAARLMHSARVNFFADTLWVKEADTAKRTRWHQDQAFFWIDGKQMCVIWFPLDRIEKENGLELVKGSHLWGKWFAPKLSKEGRNLYKSSGVTFDTMPDIEADRSAFDILSWPVEPGDCIAFHGATVHGAPGTGRRRRSAFSTIWMGDDAVYTARPSAGRPHFEGHDLSPGDPADSPYFPRLWPRPEAQNPKGPEFARFTDPNLQITN